MAVGTAGLGTAVKALKIGDKIIELIPGKKVPDADGPDAPLQPDVDAPDSPNPPEPLKDLWEKDDDFVDAPTSIGMLFELSKTPWFQRPPPNARTPRVKAPPLMDAQARQLLLT